MYGCRRDGVVDNATSLKVSVNNPVPMKPKKNIWTLKWLFNNGNLY